MFNCSCSNASVIVEATVKFSLSLIQRGLSLAACASTSSNFLRSFYLGLILRHAASRLRADDKQRPAVAVCATVRRAVFSFSFAIEIVFTLTDANAGVPAHNVLQILQVRNQMVNFVTFFMGPSFKSLSAVEQVAESVISDRDQ